MIWVTVRFVYCSQILNTRYRFKIVFVLVFNTVEKSSVSDLDPDGYGVFADTDPDFKNPDPDPSINKPKGSNHLQ